MPLYRRTRFGHRNSTDVRLIRIRQAYRESPLNPTSGSCRQQHQNTAEQRLYQPLNAIKRLL